MRALLAIFIVIFSLQSLAKADDIKDFEIEGISVGDSLLDHFNKSKVDNNKRFPHWESKKFMRFVSTENLNQYDGLLFYFKDNGKYLISSISAVKKYPNDINECYKQQKNLIQQFKKLYNNYTINDYKSIHQQDKSGKSNNSVFDFNFNDGTSSRVICTDWSEEIGYTDDLRITLQSKEYTYFIRHEAYN